VSRAERQEKVAHFVVAAFTEEQAKSLPQRGVRLAEEAIEAAQAAGTPAAMLHRLIDHVYSRPVGELKQEIGGVGVTLLALAAAVGEDADACEAAEVDRVLSKPLEHFHRRNKEKNDAGFAAFAALPIEPYTEILADDSEGPGIRRGDLQMAVSVWSWMQERENISVAETARAFNTTPDLIRQAVRDGYWTFLTPTHELDPAKQFIEHDGE